MEANQRDAKLAAARKKLKQFKEKQKAASTLPHINGYPESSSPGPFTNGATSFNAKGGESAAVESILQLSTQLNGLLDERDASDTHADGYATSSGQRDVPSDLEARNRELAEMVKKHKEACLQLEKRNAELQRHDEELQRRLEEERSAQSSRFMRELQHAKEQLQVHIQTIGILVEEKQTLQKSTNQLQRQLQQKADELEEVSGRLKASRQRVGDLEKQLAQAVSTKQMHEQQSKDTSKDIDRLKMDVYRKSKELEDLSQQKLELVAQLEAKALQCAELEASVTDLSGKLDMSIAYVQQLTGGGSGSTEEVSLYTQQTEELRREKNDLYEKVMQYEDAYRRLAAERDQLTAQYNQVIGAMEDRHKQYASQLQQALADRDALQLRTSELEARIEQMVIENQDNQGSSSTSSSAVVVDNRDIRAGTDEGTGGDKDEKVAALMSHCLLLQQQLEATARNCDVLSSDNSQLSKLLEEREEKLSELESLSERLQDEQESRQRLLDATQSDKTALSRALSQNRELKLQLEELQNRFVKVTNDSMDTVTQLQSQEHTARELAARLDEREAEHRVALAALEERARQLERSVEGEERAARLALQQEQLADRIRHYEAQGQLVETLQRELHAAQEAVTALTGQNSELRNLVVQAANAQPKLSDDGLQTSDSLRSQEMVASLSAAIRQLEMERNQILSQYEETKKENDKLLQQLADSKPPASASSWHLDGNGERSSEDVVPAEQYQALENSMMLLQDKFTAVSMLRAELQDASERLQHENAQLQGEAETIGDYISMYHHQRAIMKERTEAKDRCIAQLAQERDSILTKVTELQALVFRLLQERDALHLYTPHAHDGRQTASSHDSTNGYTSSPGRELGATSSASARDQTDTSLLQETDGWPDSDASEADRAAAAAAGQPGTLAGDPGTPRAASEVMQRVTALDSRPPGALLTSSAVVHDDASTAHKIMALLTEMGRSAAGEHGAAAGSRSHRVLHCSHCSGPIYSV